MAKRHETGREISFEELIRAADAHRGVVDGQRWGVWKFHGRGLTLEHTGYHIRLGECTTSAEVLDWIFQLAGKSWCTAEDMEDLLEALAHLLSPQKNLCSWGVDQKFDAKAHLKKMLAEGKERE